MEENSMSATSHQQGERSGHGTDKISLLPKVCGCRAPTNNNMEKNSMSATSTTEAIANPQQFHQ
jgi:hypothetical protein